MTTKIKHIANNVITDSQINLSTIDSGEIAEGSNLYFTDARVDSRLSGGSVGAISHSQGYTQTAGTWQKQGTVGNVSFSSDGNNIAFSRNGPNYIDTPGASASLNIRTGSSYATAATIDSSQNTTFNGDVTITGQLSITGNIDQYNVTDLDVTDKTITLGSGQTEANSGGSGIVIDGSAASILWSESNNRFEVNKGLNADLNFTLDASGTNDIAVELGGGTTDNHYTYIDLIGDATYTDYGLRIIRNNSGANTSSGIHHRGTGSLFVRTDDSAPITFLTNMNGGGDERMRIDSTGNVGIGDNNPSYKLDIIAATDDGINIQGTRGFLRWNSGDMEIRNEGSYAMGFRTYDGSSALVERMRITSAGNVGIGTTSPTVPLSIRKVHATGYGSGIDMLDFKAYYPPNYDTETSKASIFVGTSDKHTLNTHGGYLAFKVNQSGFSGSSATNLIEAMRIEKNANVGIGTTNPQKALHVKYNTQHQLRLEGDNSYWNIGTGWSGYWQGSLLFATNTGEKMVINTAGSVGIGTNNPLAKLQVEGNIRMNTPDGGGAPAMTSTLEMRGYEGRGVGIKMKDSVNSSTSANDREWFVGTGYATSSFGIGYASDGSQSSYAAQNKLTIASTGNVGIGTTNPAAKLEVSGKDDAGASDLLRLIFDNSPPDTGITFADIFSTVKNRISMDSGNTNDLRISAGTQIHLYGGTTNGTSSPHLTVKSNGEVSLGKDSFHINGVREYRKQIYLTNSVSYTFDIDVKSIGASGQILEVFAGYTHYSTTYGAVIKQVWSQRSTAQSDVVIINNTVNHSTSQAGAWTFSYVDADTVRLTKSAGTYGGTGYGYIAIRGVTP